LLSRVGRLAEAATLFDQLRDAAPTVSQYLHHTGCLWGSGQIGQAEQLLQEADAIYALNEGIWTRRYDMLLADGRAAAAAALARDTSARPTKVTDEWLDQRLTVALALTDPPQADRAAIATRVAEDGRKSASFATRSIRDL